MSMNPDELVSFANTFSNRTGGPSVKKKSAAQRRRAKAKGLNSAAAIALGQPAGKKVKRVEKEQGTRTSTGSSSNKTKPATTLGKGATSPYVSAGVTKSVKDAKAKADGMKSAAVIALGNPRVKQLNMDKMKKLHYSVAAIALGSQANASPKTTKSKVTTGNGPSKPSASRASSR
jgi:hypothetical protein